MQAIDVPPMTNMIEVSTNLVTILIFHPYNTSLEEIPSKSAFWNIGTRMEEKKKKQL